MSIRFVNQSHSVATCKSTPKSKGGKKTREEKLYRGSRNKDWEEIRNRQIRGYTKW